MKNSKSLESFFSKVFPYLISIVKLNQSYSFYVKYQEIFLTLFLLKYNKQTQLSLLTTISCIDYPLKKHRFSVIYELLSLSLNMRFRIKTFVCETDSITSISSLFSTSIWCEREIWDLFGVYFESNYEIKRLLTDYGFEGHPLRKDFPISGYVESRYSDELKRVVCEPLEHSQEFRSFNFETSWSNKIL